MSGVSFVVPVHNGAGCLARALEAIVAQESPCPIEIVVVDDHSDDGSLALLRRLPHSWPLSVVPAETRGAAAALNTGIRAARYPIICQVDQDVVVGPGWLVALLRELEGPDVAAVQGYYVTDPAADWAARTMGLDLEQRYEAISGSATDHVCTGNAAYRADALHRVGLFDERFGYGYDNDMSYRLRAAGHRLVLCRDARSIHQWREGLCGYLGQQYGYGYGRLDLVAKHPARYAGDRVSPAPMMSHALLMALALSCLSAGVVTAVLAGPASLFLACAAVIVGVLALERLAAGVRAAQRFNDRTALLFVPLHLARDVAWVAAIVVWTFRRLFRRPSNPSHSMRPRPVACLDLEALPQESAPAVCARMRVLGLIPAYNEMANLSAVVAELRRERPDIDLLIIDDGSTDGTAPLLAELGVQWLRFPHRLGIGSAVRAGLRYAARTGYEAAVRIDGDGQHSAGDIERLLLPIQQGDVDVVLGSRYEPPKGFAHGWLGSVSSARSARNGPHDGSSECSHRGAPLVKRVLGACLSLITGTRVTDPTSGFCAIGPRAMAILAEHHPTGYPEPELRLFLRRNALRAIEVSVRARPRMGGRTSLTAGRMMGAAARVLLAMIIVPFRSRIEGRS